MPNIHPKWWLDGRCQGVGLAGRTVEAERVGDGGRVGKHLLQGPDEDVVRAAEEGRALRIVEDVGPVLGQLGFVLQ